VGILVTQQVWRIMMNLNDSARPSDLPDMRNLDRGWEMLYWHA
jgi:hypothetical protein